MALLTLKDVGKIYVSEGNVAVGIRGVNLSFDRGEFVAVTGKSGSGKSTLLNVISGMDTYEEGEMYIEGEVTSHYLQPEWEEYRKKYISFIFQDYNIIESFTVLENVELALMHIEDKKERKRRALALLERVGLKDRINQKGSKLSGGQKQRTVIARALAKDSPIILADEPTGNLDSKTSEEIIELLREVSKDKLLIVVTHNFEQVERYATRHVRIFDGAVESDHVLSQQSGVPAEVNAEDGGERESAGPKKAKRKKTGALAADVKNGFTLGWATFKAKPKLTVFLSLLLIVGMLAIFFITSACGDAFTIFQKSTMFTHYDGRLVATTRSGEAVTESQIKELAEQVGAENYLRYDYLLDGEYVYATVASQDSTFGIRYETFRFACTVGEHFGDKVIGRYPEEENEVFLYAPISQKPYIGSSKILINTMEVNGLIYNVTGVKYFYDNNLPAKALFTHEGFRLATAARYWRERFIVDANLTLVRDGQTLYNVNFGSLMPSFGTEADKIYVNDAKFNDLLKSGDSTTVTLSVNYAKRGSYGRYDNYSTTKTLTDEDISRVRPTAVSSSYTDIYVGTELLQEIAEDILAGAYKQFSLFFQNDAAAHAAVTTMNEAGYVAVPSDTTYERDWVEVILGVIESLFTLILWLVSIVFLAMFINLCSRRAMAAFKGDMAIMRSMGINVRVIKTGMYVRMLITLVPAMVLLLVAALVIFLTPVLNGIFTYLYAWQYALICLGMILLTVRVTHRQIRKLFKQSVKKSLKGGVSE